MAVLVIGWVAVLSAITFIAFGLDKRSARLGVRRIPERTLLGLSLLGGTPGAKFAQRRFRHKTRKQPFGTLLNAIAAIQVTALVGWATWSLASAL